MEQIEFAHKIYGDFLYLNHRNRRHMQGRSKEREKMPAHWFALKRSLNCKSLPDVHDPSASSRNPRKSGCSRSIENLKDVIHGSKRHLKTSSSPRSMASNDFLNPIKHEVIVNELKCEINITKFGGKGDSTYVGTLMPGTPGTEGHHTPRRSTTPSRKILGDSQIFGDGNGGCSNFRSTNVDPYRSSTLVCQKCGENCKNLEAVEAHHLSKHAVTELVEGESSRKIVEIICRTTMLMSENNRVSIEKILKVHNMQKTLAQFEDYREMVKVKASKLSKKHPRCLADGNELLRFYGTTVGCFLGVNGSSSLCTLSNCGVCQILRHGFSINKPKNNGGRIGVFTTSTCGRAIETIEGNQSARKAFIVCRVIAGRVHKPSENFQEMAGQSGFDSLAGKVDRVYNIEELYLLNPKALLPCFVVICKIKHCCPSGM